MTDEDRELLSTWRTRRGNRYLTLATARELDKLAARYAHLTPEASQSGNTDNW